MSKKRPIDNPDTPYSHFNPNVAPYQFDFHINSPATPPTANFHNPLALQSSQIPSRPNKRSRASSPLPRNPKLKFRDYTPRIEKTEAIMNLLTNPEDKRYRLGDFLEDIFSQETYPKLSNASQTALSSWLKGSSQVGTCPAEIVNTIYRHSVGITRDGPVVRRADFSNLAPPSRPPGFASTQPSEVSLLPTTNDLEPLGSERVNSRQGLEELMVRGTLHLVDREANVLINSDNGLKRSAEMTWDDLENISRAEQEAKIQASAPVIWAVLSTITRSPSGNPEQSSSIFDAALLFVGTIMIAIDFFPRALSAKTAPCMTVDFPAPVGAIAKTSWPIIMLPIADICHGWSFSYPSAFETTSFSHSWLSS